MKQISLWWCAIILLLVLPSLHADELITSHLFRETYAPAETVQWELFLQDTVKEPEAKDFSLKQGQITVSIAPFLKKIDQNHYFLFFTLPLTIKEGTYDLTVNNIAVIHEGTLELVSHSIPLTIKKELPLLSLFPAIFLPGEKLELTIINKGQSTNVTIAAPPALKHVYKGPHQVNQGTSRKFVFTANPSAKSEQQPLLITVTYEKIYAIPVYLAPPTQPPQRIQQPQQPFTFVTTMTRLNRTMIEDKTLEGTLRIKNNLNETLDAVQVSLSGDLRDIVQLQPESMVLAPFQEQDILITVNKQKSLAKDFYAGTLVATYQQFELSFPMTFAVMREAPAEPPTSFMNETPKEAQPPTDLDTFFNYSVQPPERVKKRPTTLISFLVVLVLAVFFYLLLRKPITKRQTFEQYVRKMEKK